ncbi:unnamed protein product [Echinostoma caproni]|uniref:Reverse transcriptase domain-containing protein n=1 Tax=Echinostoma caproni TaxID=27848 RepID=A0A183AZ67_9TREM|nr:unnamed protein product [Echinostoma caproni]
MYADDVTIWGTDTPGEHWVRHPSNSRRCLQPAAVQLTGQLRCYVSCPQTTIQSTCCVNRSGLNLLDFDWIEELGLAELSINGVCRDLKAPTVHQKPASRQTPDKSTPSTRNRLFRGREKDNDTDTNNRNQRDVPSNSTEGSISNYRPPDPPEFNVDGDTWVRHR